MKPLEFLGKFLLKKAGMKDVDVLLPSKHVTIYSNTLIGEDCQVDALIAKDYQVDALIYQKIIKVMH